MDTIVDKKDMMRNYRRMSNDEGSQASPSTLTNDRNLETPTFING